MTVSILVVDDEPDVAELFRQHFRREARQGTYVIHFAAPAEKALDLRFSDLPVMMVTAYGDDERRRRADELGAVDFLAKPVDFDALKRGCANCQPPRIDKRRASEWRFFTL
ncbi:MAG TPA: hypothetical protein VKF83_03765 [Stellaceae bacterium]|nr:hypothetical protein [Stellaceae bacterium]HMD63075.1 hypothetical protein [Stellaceae bacterium]